MAADTCSSCSLYLQCLIFREHDDRWMDSKCLCQLLGAFFGKLQSAVFQLSDNRNRDAGTRRELSLCPPLKFTQHMDNDLGRKRCMRLGDNEIVFSHSLHSG